MSKQRLPKLMIIVSALLAVAPKCPLCLWAFFGTFGVAALSGSVYRVWLPPITAIWLALSVGALVVRSGGRRRYGPALLALFAGLAVFVGKFMLDVQALIYVGIAALLGAFVWRACIRTLASSELCPQCEGLPVLHDEEPGKKRPVEVPTYGGH
jgi:hypothetical protein